MPLIKSIYCSIILLSLACASFGQGQIDHIKNQPYLTYYYEQPFDCDNRTDIQSTTLHDKICANLKLQESDSILTILYDNLLTEMATFGGDTLVQNFVDLQTTWRDYRATHCKIIWDDYEGCGGCNTRAAHFMGCMREVTDLRVEELQELLEFYQKGHGGRHD